MIIERRQILFDFVEAHGLLCQALANNRMYGHVVPATLPSHQIFGALHTRHFDEVLPDLRNFMRALVKDAPPEGVIFRTRKINAGREDKDAGFVVPEKMMLDLLVAECIKRKIVLPRKADKKCFTREMYIGFGFTLESGKTAGLELALE